MLNENIYVWIAYYDARLNTLPNKRLNYCYISTKKIINSRSVNVYNKIQNAIVLKMIEYRLRYS